MQPVHTNAFDWNLLLAFEALWAERNVTRAAERLGLTQSATSHALSRLRIQLGDPLFTATPGGMVPTQRAQALAEPLREAIALVRSTLEASAAFDPLTTARTFTVSSTDYVTLTVLPTLLRDLAARAPLFDFVMRPTDDSALRALRSGEHDLLLGVGVPSTPGIRLQRLFEDTFVCVRRKRKGRRLPRLTLQRYASLGHLLVSPPGSSGDAPVDVALRALGMARRVVLRLPHFLVTPLVLAESDYVMTVPSRLAAVFAQMLPLAVELPPLALPAFGVEMAWHERDDGEPAHRLVRQRIVAATRRRRS